MRFGKLDDRKGAGCGRHRRGSRKYLFSLPAAEEGYWCGELGADTTLESDYILLHRLLGTAARAHDQKCANEILRHQNRTAAGPSSTVAPRTSAHR